MSIDGSLKDYYDFAEKQLAPTDDRSLLNQKSFKGEYTYEGKKFTVTVEFADAIDSDMVSDARQLLKSEIARVAAFVSKSGLTHRSPDRAAPESPKTGAAQSSPKPTEPKAAEVKAPEPGKTETPATTQEEIVFTNNWERIESRRSVPGAPVGSPAGAAAPAKQETEDLLPKLRERIKQVKGQPGEAAAKSSQVFQALFPKIYQEVVPEQVVAQPPPSQAAAPAKKDLSKVPQSPFKQWKKFEDVPKDVQGRSNVKIFDAWKKLEHAQEKYEKLIKTPNPNYERNLKAVGNFILHSQQLLDKGKLDPKVVSDLNEKLDYILGALNSEVLGFAAFNRKYENSDQLPEPGRVRRSAVLEKPEPGRDRGLAIVEKSETTKMMSKEAIFKDYNNLWQLLNEKLNANVPDVPAICGLKSTIRLLEIHLEKGQLKEASEILLKIPRLGDDSIQYTAADPRATFFHYLERNGLSDKDLIKVSNKALEKDIVLQNYGTVPEFTPSDSYAFSKKNKAKAPDANHINDTYLNQTPKDESHFKIKEDGIPKFGLNFLKYRKDSCEKMIYVLEKVIENGLVDKEKESFIKNAINSQKEDFLEFSRLLSIKENYVASQDTIKIKTNKDSDVANFLKLAHRTATNLKETAAKEVKGIGGSKKPAAPAGKTEKIKYMSLREFSDFIIKCRKKGFNNLGDLTISQKKYIATILVKYLDSLFPEDKNNPKVDARNAEIRAYLRDMVAVKVTGRGEFTQRKKFKIKELLEKTEYLLSRPNESIPKHWHETHEKGTSKPVEGASKSSKATKTTVIHTTKPQSKAAPSKPIAPSSDASKGKTGHP